MPQTRVERRATTGNYLPAYQHRRRILEMDIAWPRQDGLADLIRIPLEKTVSLSSSGPCLTRKSSKVVQDGEPNLKILP
jgi:hypothetical protein